MSKPNRLRAMWRIARHGAQRYRKGIAVALGGLSWVVSAGYLHGTSLTVASLILAIASTAGVVMVPNRPKSPPTGLWQGRKADVPAWDAWQRKAFTDYWTFTSKH